MARAGLAKLTALALLLAATRAARSLRVRTRHVPAILVPTKSVTASVSGPEGRRVTTRDRRASRRSLRGWLAHPLMLVVVGAVLSSLLIPLMTRQWQDDQKAREVKTALIDDVNGLASSAIAEAGAFVWWAYTRDKFVNETPTPVPAVQSWSEYHQWHEKYTVETQQIGGRIRAYTGDDPMLEEWKTISDLIYNYWAIAKMCAVPYVYLSPLVDSMADDLAKLGSSFMLDTVVLYKHDASGDQGFWIQMQLLGNEIAALTDAFVQRVLDADLSGFQDRSPLDILVDGGRGVAERIGIGNGPDRVATPDPQLTGTPSG